MRGSVLCRLSPKTLRPALPVRRCFSVLVSNPPDEASAPERAERRPLQTTLKGLQASALRTRLATLPALAGGSAEPRAARGFASAAQEVEVYTPAPVLGRFCVTAEVVISKIFPAGFGWQGSSCVAEQAFGLQSTDAMFFFVTGVGDGLGVVTGALAVPVLCIAADQSVHVFGRASSICSLILFLFSKFACRFCVCVCG